MDELWKSGNCASYKQIREWERRPAAKSEFNDSHNLIIIIFENDIVENKQGKGHRKKIGQKKQLEREKCQQQNEAILRNE